MHRIGRGLVFLFVAGLVLACAHSEVTSPRMDPTLVRAWSPEMAQQDPAPYPLVAHFRKAGKNLYFLAGHHSNQLGNPTFSLIDRILESAAIGMIVLEGFPRSYGVSPARMEAYSRKDGEGGFFRGGETSYVIQRAERRKIPFVGGEPDEPTILKAVQARGYSLEDLLFFYFVRQVPEYHRDRSLTRETIAQAFQDLLKGYMTKLSLSPEKLPRYADFLDWYARKNGEPFDERRIDTETPAPLEQGKLFTQRLAAVVDRARNEFIVTAIAESLGHFDNVLVVYGSGHFVPQRAALQVALGPEIEIIRPGDPPSPTRASDPLSFELREDRVTSPPGGWALELRDQNPFSGCWQIDADLEARRAELTVHIRGYVPRRFCVEKDPPPASRRLTLPEPAGKQVLALEYGGDRDEYDFDVTPTGFSLQPREGNASRVATALTKGEYLRVPRVSLWVSAVYDRGEGPPKLRSKLAEFLEALSRAGAQPQEPERGRYGVVDCCWIALDPKPSPSRGQCAPSECHFFLYGGDFGRIKSILEPFRKFDRPHWKPGPYLSIFVKNAAGEMVSTLN